MTTSRCDGSRRSGGPGIRAALAVALVALLALGCAGDSRRLSPSGYAGVELTTPGPKPEFTLTATDGRRYDFRRETDGRVTLLFFGYTHCPDICPVHMSNIATVLERLPPAVTREVRVVFVTTDPERDTPERLRDWLDKFDRDFVGLTGTPEELARAQIAAGVLPASRDSTASKAADYAVGHAAQVLAYTPDNLNRVQYPFGTRQVDWAHDLPLLVQVHPEER